MVLTINYPTVDQIIKIHKKSIHEFRNSNDQIVEAILSDGNIYWNIEFSKMACERLEKYERKIVCKAAHLMVLTFCSHPFVDGNKRTGFSLFVMFLDINGLMLRISPTNYQSHVFFFKSISKEGDNLKINVRRVIDWYFNS